MDLRWSDVDARAAIAAFAGAGEDLALRVYTSRLLGRERALVLHGGGNTSVKTRVTDLLGDEVEVLTPRSIVAVLAAGYRPMLHPSAAALLS